MGKRGLADISEEMQFELQVLEVVLDYVTAFMEHLTSDIEAVAYPGLDAIVIKVLARGFGQQPSIRLKSHAQSVTGASHMTELELSVGMGKLAIALALGKAQLQTLSAGAADVLAQDYGTVLQITERRLDRLRTVKSRLASLTSRVETVR